MTWKVCTRGHWHYGRHGAAGLLLVDDGRVLLQLRSGGVHHGGTWAIPGGAREPGETAAEAALREAAEEIGLDPAAVVTLGEYVDECGGWTYTTVLASLSGAVALRGNWETAVLRWVPYDAVEGYPLHPAFRAAWDSGLRGRATDCVSH